jgi:hypothetical protein
MIKRPLLQWATRLVLLLGAGIAPLQAQKDHESYDEVDPWLGFDSPGPAPDSNAVATFLVALPVNHPAICQLAVSAIGNHWEGRGGSHRIGLLEAETTQQADYEMFNHPVTDSRALALLAEALGHQHPCGPGAR